MNYNYTSHDKNMEINIDNSNLNNKEQMKNKIMRVLMIIIAKEEI